MMVVKYIPERLFGFVMDPEVGLEVYFHLGDFDPKGPWPASHHLCPISSRQFNWASPPPILGETVAVVVVPVNGVELSRPPRAQRVVRLDPPILLRGVVDSFDPQHGYGFVRGVEDGVSYHLHRSEMIDGQFPQVGSVVMFFVGVRQGRPRAIHAHVCGG